MLSMRWVNKLESLCSIISYRALLIRGRGIQFLLL